MDGDTKHRLQEAAGELTAKAFSERIDWNLRMGEFKPALHLPMLASLNQGPGFPNLSCLGRVADRILDPYVQPI
jgi:mycobactin lysine-N-oxygenase